MKDRWLRSAIPSAEMKAWGELEILDRVTTWLVDSLAFVEDDLLKADTPCGDWNVGQLLDHIAGGNWFTIEKD